jgi:integrase
VKGNLTRRGKKSWRLKFDAGRDPATGKRVTKFVTLRGSKAEAQAEAAKLIAGHSVGQFVDPHRETVAQFATRWLRDWAADNIGNRTYTSYEQILRKHVIPRIGGIPIQRLRAADLQGVYAAMATMSDRSRLHAHRVVHRMLTHAAQWGVVHQNVAGLLDAPKARSKEVEVLPAQQAQTAIERLRGRPLHAIATVLLGTGARRNEALALRWSDIDLDGGMLRIERALEHTARGGLVFKTPKTKWGKRMIKLAPGTVATLRAHRLAQQEQRLALGLGRIPDAALVFAMPDGSPLHPTAVSQEWRRVMRQAGLALTLHSLRHTHASTLINASIDILTISRRLGHGSPAITLNVYGHLLKPDNRAADAIERALAGIEG